MSLEKLPYYLVVGASRGLGEAIAKKLVSSGKLVVCTSSQASRLKEFEEKLGVSFAYLDLIEVGEIGVMCKDIILKHGIPEGLVINSGVGNDKVLGTMNDNDILSTITINFTGVMLSLKYLSRAMLLNRKGTIVVIGSITANTGYSGLSVYGATKAALEGAVRGLSRELGKRNIRINAVHPGFMATAMTSQMGPDLKSKIESRSPFKRFVTTQEVADVVDFLCSDSSKGISGASLTVDLGATA